VLFVLGMVLSLGAMRRRVGIPMLAGEPSRSVSKDMLTAGIGLGGIIYAVTHFDALIPRTGMPRPPATMLNEALPVLSGIADIPTNALMMVAVAGIPLLVVAGLTPRWSLRALVVTAIAAMVGALVWSAGPASNIDPIGFTLVIASLVIASLAAVSVGLVAWGSQSGWSWIVAALAFQGLGGLRNAAYGPVWQARGAGALTVLVAFALIALIARNAARGRGATERRLAQL
jgi:hypothetical protein